MTETITEFFGYKAMPFGKDGDYFLYGQLDEVKEVLRLTVQETSMALVSGQAGTGKTTAVSSFVDDLPSNSHQVIYLGQDQHGGNLLRRLCFHLGIKPRVHRSQLPLQVSQYLSENLAELGRNVVLIVDECHLLDLPTLEDLRLLTNAEFDRRSPLAVILVAQLIFRRQLKNPGWEALNQRIRFRYALEGFSAEETSAYIKHRLKSAGASEDLFSADALKLVFAASGGIPREINNLASAAMLRAFALGTKKIDARVVKQVLDQKELN
jgi:type II secretory pathway predicted ATPase ExeA